MTSAVEDYLPRLHAIYFTIFDDHQGLKMIHEVPEGAVSQPAHPDTPSLFDLTSEYVIPRQGLCGHLVTVCTGAHKVLGYPLSLSNAAYERQIFVFNVAFVFERDAELAAYEPLVRKTGRVLGSLEQSSHLLSSTEKRIRMHSILEQLYEDLNSYSETRIQLDGTRALELKLFPVFPNPPKVQDWEVPVLLVDLSTFADSSWDLVLRRLIPFIDGTRSVKRIADESDVHITLTRECLRHLLYYSCVVMIDLFQFSNCYVLTGGPLSLPATAADVPEEGVPLSTECSGYVSTTADLIPPLTLLRLYANLEPGLTVTDWMEQNNIHLLGLDVRRFVSFGVIKAASKAHPLRSRSSSTKRSDSADPTQTTPVPGYPAELADLLDGQHHTDELCLQFRTNFATLKTWMQLIGGGPVPANELGRVHLLWL